MLEFFYFVDASYSLHLQKMVNLLYLYFIHVYKFITWA